MQSATLRDVSLFKFFDTECIKVLAILKLQFPKSIFLCPKKKKNVQYCCDCCIGLQILITYELLLKDKSAKRSFGLYLLI